MKPRNRLRNTTTARASRKSSADLASESELTQVIRDIPIPAAVVRFENDQTWRILHTNAAFGARSSPMQGTSLATHFTVSDGEDFSALSVERTEVRAVSRPKVGDAVDVVLTFSGTIVADPSLRLLFVQAVDQRALSNASKSARDQLQTFFHDSRDITYVLDQRGRLVDVNEFGAKQLGYSRDELISGQHSVQIHEADRRTVNDRYTQVLRGEAHRFEARFIRRNGSVMLASILARPNFQNGEVTGLIGDARDITKQRAAQTQLQEGEQRYRALFVDHVDAVLTTDREGNFLHANPAFERMIGRKAETLQGTDYLPLIVPELREYTSRQYDQAVEGHTVEYETRIAGSAHNEIDLYVTLIPVIINDAVEEIHCIAKDVTAFRKAQRDLERMAFTHRVTGLPNRNALEQHLTSLVQLGDMFSVLNLDLDRFKTVNDRYGRKVGDDILRAVAERLCGFITAPTRLFQYSGDNFVIVHQHARDEEAFEFASKIEHLIRGPFAIDGQEIIISVSIGVCVFPEYGFDPESLMRRSEDAMLEAKKRGRSHVAFFRELNSDDGARLLKLEFGLQHALENEDLTIVYQPQVNVQTGDIHGVEALLRWTDPELGTISPAEFIPVAERNGTIHDIGMWVIEEACRQLKSWENLDSHHFRLAVNASIVQFYDAEFYVRLAHAIHSSGIAPESLVIEVTESIAANADVVVTQLHKLKALGVGIALDDFGTGYSSLRHLRDFPVDYLKIDRSFIAGLVEHTEDRNLVSTVIELARSFGLSTVAEGVETAEQLRILQDLGAPFAQGYFISHPLSPVEFEKWLDTKRRA